MIKFHAFAQAVHYESSSALAINKRQGKAAAEAADVLSRSPASMRQLNANIRTAIPMTRLGGGGESSR